MGLKEIGLKVYLAARQKKLKLQKPPQSLRLLRLLQPPKI
jgi:hypothetical protein